MAVTLRLRREGTTKRPYYKIVATDKRNPRDGKFIEIIGSYDPKLTGDNFTVDLPRIEYWLKNGAEISETVASIVKKARKKVAKSAAAA
jgi:small subunit ribosomal protein S16